MVCQDDISNWFRRARGPERIEVLCGLLQLCNPLELRFIGTCVEDLAKKDFVGLREDELKANDTAQLRVLSDGSIFDDKTRSKLIFSVSLLYSLNTVCAHVLYEVLSHIQTEVLQHQAYCTDGKSLLLNPCVVDDILLLFTLATNHPAFTFSERQLLYASFKNVERLIAEFLAKLEPTENTPCSTPQANPPTASSVSLPVSSSSTTIDSKINHVDVSPPNHLSPLPKSVHVKNIDMKGSQSANHSRKTEFSIQVTWSNGDVTMLTRTYQELHSFHLKLLKLFPKESNAHKSERVLPYFPQGRIFFAGSQPREVLEALRKYFRQLSATPYISSNHLAEFFGEKNPPQTVKTRSQPSRTVSSTDGVTNDVSLLSVCSSHSETASSDSQPANRTLVPSDHVVTTKATQRHAYSQPLSTRPPSPPHCTHSPITSPIQCSSSYWPPAADPNEPSIDEWLKKIRLHKYSGILCKYTWSQLCQLSDRDLTNEGLTQGAKRKLISEISKLRDGEKNGVIVGINHLSPTEGGSLSPQWSVNSSSPQPRSDGHNLDGVDSSCSEYSSPPRSPNLALDDPKEDLKPVKPSSPTQNSYVSMEPKCPPGVMEAPPPLPPPPPYAPHFTGNMRLPPNIHFMAHRPMLRCARLPMQRPPLMVNNTGCSSPDHTSNSPAGCNIKSSISCPQIQDAIASDAYKFSTNGPMMGTSLVCTRPNSLAAQSTSSSPPLTVSTDTSSPPTPRHTPPLTSTSECTLCGHCGQNRPLQQQQLPPMQFTAGGMWPGMPMPMMHPMPPNGLPFISPEVLFNNQANFVMQQHRPPPPLPLNGAGLLGQHPLAAPSSASHYPMHAPQPGLLMGQLMHPVFTKMNKGPMCCNCGANGHRGTECKESTFDMMTRSGQYHLNMAPKSESE